ncbi:MAG: hypothetical protein U0176_23045 [Bacteroidia bacterium]
MNLLHESIKKDLATLIQSGLKALGAEESVETLYNLISPAPSIEMGQLAFLLFTFAGKALRSAPQQPSADLAAAMPQVDWIAVVAVCWALFEFRAQDGSLGGVGHVAGAGRGISSKGAHGGDAADHDRVFSAQYA